MTDKPVTREEKYLAYLTGDYTGELPKPITRKEKYLYELCLKGIGGEISPEEIKAAVNEYLEKNPVKPGATTEQTQQIEQNKTNIASLKTETSSLKEDLATKITYPATASIGQTIRVAAVDDAGRPTEWEAIDITDDELLLDYTLNQNRVIQPTAFDANTGIFTCAEHGMNSNLGAILIMNNDAPFYGTKIPKKSLSATLHPENEDEFTVKNWDFSSADNLDSIDVSSFHYEIPSNFFVKVPFSDFKKLRIQIVGKIVCTSWLNFACNLTSNPIIEKANTGSHFNWGRPGYAFGAAEGIFYFSAEIENGDREIVSTRNIYRCDSNGGNVQFQTLVGRYKPVNSQYVKLDFSYSGSNEQGMANGARITIHKIS